MDVKWTASLSSCSNDQKNAVYRNKQFRLQRFVTLIYNKTMSGFIINKYNFGRKIFRVIVVVVVTLIQSALEFLTALIIAVSDIEHCDLYPRGLETGHSQG
jgi:hypothetical protein